MTKLKQSSAKSYFFLRNYILKKFLFRNSKIVLGGRDKTITKDKNRIIRKLNLEKNLDKNWNVLRVLQTFHSNKALPSLVKVDSAFLKKNRLFKYTPIYLSLTKEFILLNWEKKRQFFFFFNEFLVSLAVSNKTLLKELSFFFEAQNAHLKEKSEILLFENYLDSIFFGKQSQLTYGSQSNILNALLLKSIQVILLNNVFRLMAHRITKESFILPIKAHVLDLYGFWYLDADKWDLYGLPIIINNNSNTNEYGSSELILKQNKFISVIRRRTKLIPQTNLINYNAFIKNNNFTIKPFIWKSTTKFTSNNFFGSIVKLSRLYNKQYNLSNKKTPFKVLYLISRIEDKIAFYTKTNNTSILLPKLIRLRNLFLFLIQEKTARVMNESLLTSKSAILRVKNKTWKLKLLTYLHDKLKRTSLENNHVFYNFINLIYDRLAFGRRNLLSKYVEQKSGILNASKKFIYGNMQNSSFFKSNPFKRLSELKTKSWANKVVTIKRNWVGSKLVLAEKHLTFTQKKTILSTWINRPVDLFFINALSLTKFAFKNERSNSPNNNPNAFLSVLDRDFINKYKYVGIYIKDLVRVAFISVFFKKPSFLAKFMAFQLSRLPRNRKETNFVRFLIKVIKTFAAERKEILGIRIRFKGRVNRWRRTKFILGNRGTLPLQTISERIEQGSAQAVNKKGAVGIRIWLRYKQSFSLLLKDHILKYLNYSKILRARKVTRNLLLK